MTKRLFLFAAYDAQGVVDATLLHYLRALSTLGDIIVTMDNDLTPDELQKFSDIPHILHVAAGRHGEYDFGSYKRGYQYARDKKLLGKYDWVYLANDSVVGPVFPMGNILDDLEGRGVDLTGMIDYISHEVPIQVQSWFVGLSRHLARSKLISNFFECVGRESDKQVVVLKYEVRLSQLVLRGGYRMSTLVQGQDGDICHMMYEKPIEALKHGIPFVKKAALIELPRLQYLYPFVSPEFMDAIAAYMRRTMGDAKTRMQTRTPYVKCFKFALFMLPIFSIYRQDQQESHNMAYKLYLFDKLPICKISMTVKR